MTLKPLDDIHMEVHNDHDQFIKIEKGFGTAIIDNKEYELKDGIGLIIPAGTSHQIINNGKNDELKLYTIYSPPEHKQGVQQINNPDKNKNINNVQTNIPIFFIRHGESKNNKKFDDYDCNNADVNLMKKLKDINMESDPKLTDTGINQSLMLGVFLKNNMLQKNRKIIFYTSPFLRTLQTTKYIIKNFNIDNYEVIVHPDIYENGGSNFINNNLEFEGPVNV